MVYGSYIVTWGYKPTYDYGAPHCTKRRRENPWGKPEPDLLSCVFFFSHSLLVVDPGYMVESLNWGISPAKAGACETKLVGGLEHDFIFPYIGNSHPN